MSHMQKIGRLMELDTKKTGISQETVDDFKDMDRRLYQVLISCTNGEAKNCVCNPERSGFMAWKQNGQGLLRPEDGV